MTVLCLGICLGCVRRRLTVRTNPAGASAYVDKQPIGTTPTSTPFTYYGTREIEVVADGYRTEKILRKIHPPWYQLPPLDFLSETLWPWEIRDERVLDISMVPNPVPASEQLQARAEGMRVQAAQGLATPLPQLETGPTTGLPGLGYQPQSAVLPQGSATPPAVTLPATPSQQPPVMPAPPFAAPQQNNPGHHDLDWLPQRIPEVGGSYRPPIEVPSTDRNR